MTKLLIWCLFAHKFINWAFSRFGLHWAIFHNSVNTVLYCCVCHWDFFKNCKFLHNFTMEELALKLEEMPEHSESGNADEDRFEKVILKKRKLLI